MVAVIPMIYVLVAAFVVNVEGMRGPPEPTAVLERKTLQKDRCAAFGAETNEYGNCQCPKDRPLASPECHNDGFDFYYSRAVRSPGCRCESTAAGLAGLQVPVSASALEFCTALVEEKFSDKRGSIARMEGAIERTLRKTSPEICQHALTGTITPGEAGKASWAPKSFGAFQKRHGTRSEIWQDETHERRCLKRGRTEVVATRT